MRGLSTALLFSAALLVTTVGRGQDEAPSLGDVARQARLQKRKDAQAADSQSKNAQSKDGPTRDALPSDSAGQGKATPKGVAGKDVSARDIPPKGPRKIITNDEIPEHVGPTSTLTAHPNTSGTPLPPRNYGDGRVPPEYWKDQIQAMKDSIAGLQDQIKDLSDSVQYAGTNCIPNCVSWNQQQLQRQQQLDMVKTQLEQQQKRLEQMQEFVRRQGYSSSVWDP